MSALTPEESAQVDICRIICLFFMMYTHVHPPVPAPTFVFDGPAHAVWVVLADFLGRASVATLSFLGGFILYATARDRSLASIARTRFRSVYLPMLTWSAIAVAVIVWWGWVGGDSLSAMMERQGISSARELLSAITALEAQPANLPIGFLRDLFVSILITRLLIGFMPRAGLPILGVILVLTLFRATEPIVLRPMILLFVFAGALVAQRGWRLADLSRPSVAFSTAAGFGLALLLASLAPLGEGILAVEIPNFLRRAALVGVVLAAGAVAAAAVVGRDLQRLRQVLFVAFLSHGIATQVLIRLYEGAGFDVADPLYLAFFLASPLLFLIGGLVVSLVIDHLPEPAQVALRGSIRARRRRLRPSVQ